MIRIVLTTLALLIAAVSPSLADELKFPPLTGRVVDEVGVLSPEAQDRLTSELATHEQRSGQQVVVAVVKSLEGRPIEDYGYQLGRAWGIGQKGKNTGAILLVAPNEHKMRIEVGYGLEGQLTDAISSTIINGIIAPRFRQGDLEGGIVDGAEQILRVLGDDPVATPLQHVQHRQTSEHASPGAIILTFVIFGLFLWLSRRSRGGLGSPILPFLIASSWSSRGIGSSYSGGSSGGGFFSGGGGSFGGGGASGSW